MRSGYPGYRVAIDARLMSSLLWLPNSGTSVKCITAACSPGPAASVFDVAETIQFLPQFWACLERPSRFVSHNLAIFRLGVRWTVEGFAKRSG